ncbi:uncharacterized protein LOC134949046 [Pseudophryne corroboree]|uniref:uncharacterized protein LOC134949046 n=1 Tax=Pseudophryne corroboree TaxID=495146 RepID=UPI003081D019
MPVGTKDPVHQLRRMVLKDIKNDPDLSAGSQPSLASSKRRMSDPECMSSLPQKSKFRKGILQKGVDYCLAGYDGGQNIMNICSDITNSLDTGTVALQSKELKKSTFCKAESSRRGESKNDYGIVPTVTAQESVPPLPREMRLSFPEKNLASKRLSTSGMLMPYFADPTIYNENEEPVSAELTADNSNKFFSTPMASKQVKKKLTPVMELDIESYTSEERTGKDNISSRDIIHKNSYVLSPESPAQTPIYRSFFAAECEEIVNCIGTVVKSPAKRKAHELDVSTIDAEPPPYDCTPMKSMLACEVASMMHSLDNSPVMEGISLFGESLLDLERMDLQFNDLNVPECNKSQSLSNSGIEGIFYLSGGLNGSCSKKRQKTEQLVKNESAPNSTCQTEMMGHLVRVTDHFIPEILQTVNNKKTCDLESISDCASNNNGSINTKQSPKFHSEGITLVGTTQVMKVEHRISDHITEPVVLMRDNFVTLNSKVMELSPKDLANTTQNIALVHEEITVDSSMPLNDRSVSKRCSNITQKTPIHLTLDTTSMHKEFTTVNATHENESVPQTSNITQDLSSLHEEINIADTTRVIDLVSQTSPNITYEVSSIHEEVDTVNITQVIEVGQQNTTQDITSMHEEVTATNSTQVIEVGPQSSTNPTQDISSMHEVASSKTTHVIEIESSANTTRDIVSIHKEIPTGPGMGIMDIVPRLSASNTEVTAWLHEVVTADTTQDIPSVHEDFTTANTTQVTELRPQSSTNTTQDIVSLHEENPTAHHLQIMGVVPQLTASNTAVTALVDEFITVNKADDLQVASEASANGTQATPSILNEVIMNTEENVDSPSILHPQNSLKLKSNVTQMPESGEDQTLEMYMACGATDNGTLLGTQSKPNITEGALLNTVEEKCYKSVVVLASLQNEVDACKESNVYPLLSESCTMIQEEENVQDVSVFSAGSHSFVTSTPVPGYNNFQFQKPCQDSVPQDPKVSLGAVSGDSTNKVPVQQGITTQPMSLGTQALNNSQNKPISRRSLLPPYTGRCIRPPSGLIPRQIPPPTSGIPSARRSLALFNTTGQNPVKEPMLSKNAPTGIPGRGIIRPSLARQSLPRVGPGNLKQATEGAGASIMADKFKGSRFRTPKAVPTKDKVRTGPQNPRLSSLHPPLLQHSQKVSAKLESNISWLPVKKTITALESRKVTGSMKCESVSAKSSTTRIPPSAANLNEAAFLQGGVKSSSSSLVEQVTENQENLDIPISALEASASLPATTSVQTESKQCTHLETCKWCRVKYSQLLQELEDLKRLGDV